jgi:hypothetical protein
MSIDRPYPSPEIASQFDLSHKGEVSETAERPIQIKAIPL